MTEVDAGGWSGEGEFTQILLDHLRTIERVAALKVEDAPSTRSDAGYNFVSNEVFVTFAISTRREPIRRFGILPGTKLVPEKALTIAGLEKILDAVEGIGPADYADEGMLQFLRTERIVPPYQTKGYKLIELVRIYEAGTTPRI